MTQHADEISNWIRAGGDALLVNSPMAPDRFEALTKWVAGEGQRNVIDFGCGRGAFAHRVAELTTTMSICGLDTSPTAIDHAQALADEAGLSPRLRFELLDASEWVGTIDTGICIGSSHALGGPEAMFKHVWDLGATRAVIGDGFWQSEPDEWCRSEMGEMPVGIDSVIDLATSSGWEVVSASSSTLVEWDAFEEGWGAGVRTFETEGAKAFADERSQEYTRYRGVLGFVWLQLRHPN